MKIIETVYDLFLKFYCLRVSVNVAFDRLTSNNGVFGVPSGRWTTSSGVGRRLFREVCFLSVLGTFCWPGVLPFFLVEREWLHDKGCSVWLQCAGGKGLTLRPIWYSANPAVNDILPYMCWYVHNLAADDDKDGEEWLAHCVEYGNVKDISFSDGTLWIRSVNKQTIILSYYRILTRQSWIHNTRLISELVHDAKVSSNEV